jgi:HD-GYP domain-containing protein (c-di-GMP phosphodiesterase class II)
MIQVSLMDMIFGISDALDLVGVDDYLHGKRVAVIAAECARQLGLSPGEINTVLYAGMLHDCGVSSTRTHRHLVDELDWDGSHVHCARGASLVEQFVPLAHFAPIITHHHTHWCNLPPHLSPAVARHANLIYLADRVDALTAHHNEKPEYLLHKDYCRNVVAESSGVRFDPELVEAFLTVSRRESFWLHLEPRYIWRYLTSAAEDSTHTRLDFPGLRSLARVFSEIIDAKSPFTVEHSLCVAQLARHLAGRMGLDADTCDKIEIAGMLHDLGKLRVPDEVLENSGPLDAAQRAAILRHSFETFQILSWIRGFDDIALWAAAHHERMDGNGYPFRFKGDALPLPARIIAVADVCQALVQDRPYRNSLAAEEVVDQLEAQVRDQHLDGDVVRTLREDFEQCWALAQAGSARGKNPLPAETAAGQVLERAAAAPNPSVACRPGRTKQAETGILQ